MANKQVTVSLIIPTLNEAGCIERIISEVPKEYVDEIIVVDGHSTDGTIDIVKKLSGVRLIMQESKGFGGAFSEGIKASKCDVVVLCDGDGSHNVADIPKLIAEIEKGFDYVMAARYRPGSRSEDDTLIRYFGNIFFTFLTNLLHRVYISDCLYLFTAARKSIFDKIELKSQGFEFCIEILVKVHKAGFKISEIPSVERLRYSGSSKVNAFKHGVIILIEIIKGLRY